jgi:hypothetical protein
MDGERDWVAGHLLSSTALCGVTPRFRRAGAEVPACGRVMTNTVERNWIAEAMEILVPKNHPERWVKNVKGYDPHTMTVEEFCRDLVIADEKIKSGEATITELDI